jgi:deoxyadenosine/deoxycytidine kinase
MDGFEEFFSTEGRELRKSLHTSIERSKAATDGYDRVKLAFDKCDRSKSCSPLLACSASDTIPRMTNRIVIVHVEGNIGAGKETFMKHVESLHNQDGNNCLNHNGLKFNAVFCYEPVDEFAWLLKLGKDDPGVNWYFIQTAILRIRMEHMIKHLRIAQKLQKEHPDMDVLLIIERSLYGDYVFAKVTYEDSRMTDAEYAEYRAFWKFCYDSASLQLDYCVYICPPVDQCPLRIKARTRDFEQTIPIEYLESLQRAHDEQFVHEYIACDTASFVDSQGRKILVYLHENPAGDEQTQLDAASGVLVKMMNHIVHELK